MEKLYIIIPAYNEEENISQVIADWYPVIEKHNGGGRSALVVVNDGSRDRTYERLCELAREHPALIPLTKENGGHGSAVLYGYRYALEHGADYIFQTDSDGQTDPAEFEQFWEAGKTYDAVIGTRTVRGDGRLRKCIENIVCLLLRICFKVKVKDANAPYRLMKREVLAKYITRLPKDYHLPNIMLTTFFVYYKERVKFIEISFKPRQGGENSINFKKIIRIGWDALGDFYRFKKDMKKDAQSRNRS